MSNWKTLINNVVGEQIGQENIDQDWVDYLAGTNELALVLASKKTGQDLSLLRDSLMNELQNGTIWTGMVDVLDRRNAMAWEPRSPLT